MPDHETPVMGEEDRRHALALSVRSPTPPLRVPGYEQEEFIGKGAFGEVWSAVDTNTRCRVAIKFFNSRGGVDWPLLSREVEKLRFLSTNQHVVKLLKVGWDADPPFYVMEYLERGSLEARLQAGPLPPTEVVALFQEIVAGLAQAQAKGILHCDLKPANILLDQDGKPRLADFGQARLADETSPALGTLFYMAPEQADLRAAPSPRWDVYALGALLYCMLTGEPPYCRQGQGLTPGPAARLSERLEGYRRLLEESPRPDGHRDVPGVDGDLAAVIDRCLAIDPDRRFPDARAVLKALHDRALNQARRPLLVFGVAGPILLLLVAMAAAWVGFRTTLHDSQEAVTQRALESDQYAARLAANRVEREVRFRWRVLEEITARRDFRDALLRARGHDPREPAAGPLRQEVARLYRENEKTTKAKYLFVNDAEGRLVALSPEGQAGRTLGKNYAWRDYFHGEGGDYPEGTRRPPLRRRAYLSQAYVSQANQQPMVGLSVPVWGNGGPEAGAAPIGVLVMTIALKDLSELWGADLNHRPENPAPERFAALLECKGLPGRERERLLRHPSFPDPKGKGTGTTAPEPPAYPLPPGERAWLDRLRQTKLQTGSLRDTPAYRDDYQDPVGATDPRFQTAWLAGFEPVVPNLDGATRFDTGWVVVVQERREAAVGPLMELRHRLRSLGLVTLIVVVLTVLALWAFVLLVLGKAFRFRFKRLKRGAGSFFGGSGSARGSTGASSSPARSGGASTEVILPRFPLSSVRGESAGSEREPGPNPRPGKVDAWPS